MEVDDVIKLYYVKLWFVYIDEYGRFRLWFIKYRVRFIFEFCLKYIYIYMFKLIK